MERETTGFFFEGGTKYIKFYRYGNVVHQKTDNLLLGIEGDWSGLEFPDGATAIRFIEAMKELLTTDDSESWTVDGIAECMVGAKSLTYTEKGK